MRRSNETTLMKALCAFIAIFFGSIGAQWSAQEVPKDPSKREWRDLINTGLSGSDCKPANTAGDQGARICKGIEGYSLLVKGDELKPEIYLIAPNQRRYQVRYWNTGDSKFRGLYGTVTWTIVHTPRETITLTFTAGIAPRQDYTYSDSYDIIARVTPEPACVIGSVSASSTSVGETVGIASSPRGRRCLRWNEREKKDWFYTARRLVSEGQINEARRALTRVSEPSERFVIYREIANAQFKTGNSRAARLTLISARAEALRDPSRDNLIYTLSQVIQGMAESGFYENARSDMKLFAESDRLRMYLLVAGIQGEKRDFEAAKVTFQEVIESELKRKPRADWNLSEIGMAQARMGLIDEARKTASVIQDPSARFSVERSIREQSPGPE